jgi:hypothetical protein
MRNTATNHSYVVDIVVLRELLALVSRSITRQDGSELREFIASRRQAYAHLSDAEPTRLEPDKLVTALADIARLEHSPFAWRPEARALLEAARMTSTRPRDVCRKAFERLVHGTWRLRKFIEFGGPDIILMDEVGIVSRALAALDHFDLSARRATDGVPGLDELLADEDLIPAALASSYVADCEGSAMGLLVTVPFVQGPELFPRPTDPGRIPGWKRFLGSGRYISPPRVALGADIARAARRAIAFRQWVEQDLQLGRRERKMLLWGLEEHISWLNFAARNRHAVVEWVVPDASEGSELALSSSLRALPTEFPAFLEPPPLASSATSSADVYVGLHRVEGRPPAWLRGQTPAPEYPPPLSWVERLVLRYRVQLLSGVLWIFCGTAAVLFLRSGLPWFAALQVTPDKSVAELNARHSERLPEPDRGRRLPLPPGDEAHADREARRHAEELYERLGRGDDLAGAPIRVGRGDGGL